MRRGKALGARIGVAVAVPAVAVALAACGGSGKSTSTPKSSGSTSTPAAGKTTSTPPPSSSGGVKIGVDLVYNNTAFWAAYVNYEAQYAKQLGISLIGPDIAGASAATQNQQIETMVNQGAKAIIINPESATSFAPAISYAKAHHVPLVSVDTIVAVGKVYMVVRANNSAYGQDACNYIVNHDPHSGDVLNLQGDMTSSNGADRSNAFTECMQKNDPGVTVESKPTVWETATAVTDAQTAINQYGSKLIAIYSPWSGPTPAIVKAIKGKKITYIDNDGVPFDMCNVQQGTQAGSQSQPADKYALYALKYAKAAAEGKTYAPGDTGLSGQKIVAASYQGDTNPEDPIVAPFVTKTAETLTIKTPVAGLPGTLQTTAATDPTLWGNVYGKAHGGDCSTQASQ